MQRWAKRIGLPLFVMAMLAAPFVAHFAVVAPGTGWWAGGLVALQTATVGWVAVSLAQSLRVRVPHWRLLRLGLCALLFIGVVVIWRLSADGLMLAAAMPHGLAYGAMLGVFAGSLLPGHKPVISRVAARARGTLTPVLVRYTRTVTIVWCGFFLFQLLMSLVLGLLAPLAWWSLFVNFGSLPLVAVMFGTELIYRHWRHGVHQPAAGTGRWQQAMNVLGQIRAPIRQQGQ